MPKHQSLTALCALAVVLLPGGACGGRAAANPGTCGHGPPYGHARQLPLIPRPPTGEA